MKLLKNILFSMITSISLMSILAISIGYATFIENKQGTEYAHEVIYNATWFELLLLFLVVNFIGSMFINKLTDKRKIWINLFHKGFLFIILGAAITRYAGYEGIMHIRNGEASNKIVSEKSVLKITASNSKIKEEKSIDIKLSPTESVEFSKSIIIDNQSINIKCDSTLLNAAEIIEDAENGEPSIALFVMEENGRPADFILQGKDELEHEGTRFAFGDSTAKAHICFYTHDNALFLKSTLPIYRNSMMDPTPVLLEANASHDAPVKNIYKVGNLMFVLKEFKSKGVRKLVDASTQQGMMKVGLKGKNAMIIKISDGNSTKNLNVFYSETATTAPAHCQIGDTKIEIAYSKKDYTLPFSIQLREFKVERYPGSNSPSSYASEITVVDKEKANNFPFRIYMNHILNYRSYRFFQSSYDTDEQGTVLSVNHDYWGTMISYLGYLLLAIGMTMTLFSKNSRFRTVMRLSNELRQKRNATIVAILLLGGFSNSVFGTEMNKSEHIKSLSNLMIQDAVQGRIEPFSTYSSDLVRKIYKKTSYNNQTPEEVIIGMIANPSDWVNEPIIKVANPQLAKELGAVNERVSFSQLFNGDNNNEYLLESKVNLIYQKQQSERSKYETEIINVDERVNICYMLLSGQLFKIFPPLDKNNNQWKSANINTQNNSSTEATQTTACQYSGNDDSKTAATCTKDNLKNDSSMSGGCPYNEGDAMEGMPQATNGESNGACCARKEPTIENTEDLLMAYLDAVNKAYTSGNWNKAEQELNKIKSYQLKYGGGSLPPTSKIALETRYNELNLFGLLPIFYCLFGFIILGLYFISIFSPKNKLAGLLKFARYPFYLLFIVYCIAMGMRWYIAEHAPWSNGYESMILVGWATSLAGLIFSRNSIITLATTGLLTSIALFTAAMSWMNPEITNLVPVLKSYWLIIHVAIITSSYGFLGMGAMLGLLNLFMMIIRNKYKFKTLDDNILEIGYIIEMTLTIGLFMLTIGCFLGGVWANESWGRYWSWDSKETWALVGILVYSVVLHLRLIPQLNTQFIKSSMALLAILVILMTYLGVNYYLSGMHSYGQGTPASIPVYVYLILVAVGAIILLAYKAENEHKN